MRNYTTRLLLVLGLILLTQASLFSQRNFGFYSGFQSLSQSHYYNPSWNANNKVCFSIGFGMQSFGISNSGFTLNDILKTRQQDDSLVIDPSGAIDKMAKLNFLGTTV
ncbi:MAG: hypothetical protein ACSHXL_06405, partial [Bacteroidota bacterium]